MRKKFKRKKKFKYNKIVLLILLFILLTYFKPTIKLSSKNVLSFILNSENKYSDNVNLYSYIKDNYFNSPIKILENQFDYKKEESSPVFTYTEKKKPIIYLYNSHQGEKYSVKYLEDYNIVPNVKIVDSMLKDKLEKYNIEAVVEESDILKYMKEHNLNHAGSYIASRNFLKEAIDKYPNAELYIDIHRDAAKHDITYTKINDKDCAKIMFVIGLEYSTYKNNLQIVTEINKIIKEKYPSLTRGILKKEGAGVNGVYNQDLKSNVILIEVGGNENNIEEINNTLDILANVLGEYINEKEKEI